MIEVGKYYTCTTPFGVRVIKGIQELEDTNVYGIYSISNYESPGDNQGMIIPNNSEEATLEQKTAWDNWYNNV